MDLANLPLFAALTRKMNWLADRQKVLAENIANADTPQYQAEDLRPLDFRKELNTAQARLELVSTDPRDITATPGAGEVPADELVKTHADRSINGNSVSLEDELIKMSQTSADYQLMTNLYKKQIGMLKEAIGQPGGSSTS